jgi:FtsP/CotA-like multicopper oxidase with cupredoxin domain
MTTRRELPVVAGRVGLVAVGVAAVGSPLRESTAASARRTIHIEARETKWELMAHNPGDGFFHCHKPMHMMGGMIALLKVG